MLQAWGVAEARHGDAGEARRLLRRCTDADPECRAAWHAWARLEEEAGDVGAARQLYRTVLRLRPGSVPALSALGRLERRAGQMQAAHQLLQEALAADPHHAPSVAEMAALLEAQVGGPACSWLGWWRGWAAVGVGAAGRWRRLLPRACCCTPQPALAASGSWLTACACPARPGRRASRRRRRG